MTPEQLDALWTYVDALERRVARDWRLCGPRLKTTTGNSPEFPGHNPEFPGNP